MIGGLLLLAPLALGLEDPVPKGMFPRFEAWFETYEAKKTVHPDPTGETAAGFKELLAAGNRPAARRLLEVASLRFDPSPERERERFSLQQPWAVRTLPAETLGRFRDPPTLLWLSKEVLLLLEGQYPLEARIAVARAAGDARHEPSLLGLLSAFSDASGELRATAVDAAGRIGGAQAARAIARRFSDPDWKVRLAALRYFTAHPDPWLIPTLIEALRQEQVSLASGKGRKRSLFAVVDALLKTGAWVANPEDPRAWQTWWDEHRDRLEEALKESRPEWSKSQLPYYFGIPVLSDRMVFLLDVSKSMEEICEASVITGERGPVLTSSEQQSKLEWAKQELIKTLRQLRKTDRFNAIFFEGAVEAVFPETVPATGTNVSRAVGRIRAVTADGGTNVYGALALSLGLEKGEGEFEADADTIFLLSDGSPTVGTLRDPHAILEAVRSSNRGALATIHTIYFGVHPSGAFDFMQSLARENAGEFRWAVEK